MMIFVITGGIASGKSNVMAELEALGWPTLSADTLGHEIANTKEARAEIKKAFGEGLYEQGKLLRKKLAALVFADKEKLDKLNTIMHKLIYAEIQKWIAEHEEAQAVAIEIPLLFESGWESLADVIIHCYVSEEEQLHRMQVRNGLQREEALQRIHAQMPTAEKMRLAHHNIDTSVSFPETRAKLYQILEAYSLYHAK